MRAIRCWRSTSSLTSRSYSAAATLRCPRSAHPAPAHYNLLPPTTGYKAVYTHILHSNRCAGDSRQQQRRARGGFRRGHGLPRQTRKHWCAYPSPPPPPPPPPPLRPHCVHLCVLAMMPPAVTCGVVSAVDRSFEEIDEGLAHSSSTRQVIEGRLARAA